MLLVTQFSEWLKKKSKGSRFVDGKESAGLAI